MQLVIDTMYIHLFNTDTVLEGVKNNHFLILVKVYAIAKKYGVEIGSEWIVSLGDHRVSWKTSCLS
jgi:hypothetical protein